MRIHPLFILLCLIACGLGMWRNLLVLFTLVSLHELGHATVANALGYEVEEVSLLPFGGVAKLSYGDIGFHPRHEAYIAIAGPLVNLAAALLGFICYSVGLWPKAFYDLVLQLNLWIAVFNLLPGLPLDGGRILRAARSRWLGYDAATEEAYRLAYLLAALLLTVGAVSLWAGYPHIGALVLGVFLGVSAWTGRRDARMETIRFLDSKRRKRGNVAEPVRAIAASTETTVKDVVRQFSPDRYHMVYIRNRADDVVAVLEERELLDAVFEGSWLKRLGELVQ